MSLLILFPHPLLASGHLSAPLPVIDPYCYAVADERDDGSNNNNTMLKINMLEAMANGDENDVQEVG